MIEQIPSFTPSARQRWDQIPAHIRQSVLSNVWCTRCSQGVRMSHITGKMQSKHLMLLGRCVQCQGVVVRVIEED